MKAKTTYKKPSYKKPGMPKSKFKSVKPKTSKTEPVKAKAVAVKSANAKKVATKKEFPERVPFWARLKINKQRTALVIDREKVRNKKTKIVEDGFVHREATHSFKKGFEEIKPNPDRTDTTTMYLKRATKKPVRMFERHNKKLDMPEDLQKRYERNNEKKQ